MLFMPVLWKDSRKNAFYLDLQVIPLPVVAIRFIKQRAASELHTSEPMQTFIYPANYLLRATIVPAAKDILTNKANRIPALKDVIYQKTDKMGGVKMAEE